MLRPAPVGVYIEEGSELLGIIAADRDADGFGNIVFYEFGNADLIICRFNIKAALGADDTGSYNDGTRYRHFIGNAMNGKIAGNGDGVAAVFCKIHFAHICNGSFKNGFGIFIAFHVVLIKMFFHQCFFKMKCLDEHRELELAGLLVENAGDLVIVGRNIFQSRF